MTDLDGTDDISDAGAAALYAAFGYSLEEVIALLAQDEEDERLLSESEFVFGSDIRCEEGGSL